MSDKRSYFWPCFWLYFLVVASCDVKRELHDIAQELKTMNKHQAGKP